jgi:S1-C subfamily serine protease
MGRLAVIPSIRCFAWSALWLNSFWLVLVSIAIAQSPRSKQEPIDFAQLQAKIDSILPRIRPAVVSIECGGGSGSGVIVSADGLVLTAAHVIDKGNELTILYPDGRRFKGKALGSFGPADAAMAQIVEAGPHPFVNFATGKDLRVNDTVLSLGHPGGFDLQRGTPLRIGHILAIKNHFLQIDSALIGGDSGGPTFDLEGNVIGIHSNIAGPVHINNDSHISSFHLAWESMLAGKHDSQHYSESLREKERQEQSVPSPMDSKSNAKDGNVSDKDEPTTPGSERAPSKLKSLVEQSKANGGSLKLSREELLQLRQELATKTESLTPNGGSRLADAWANQWIDAFPLASEYGNSVYPVIVGGRKCALATSVAKNGLLITKASEVKGKSVTIEVEPKRFVPAEIVAIAESLDLALVRVADVALAPINLTRDSLRIASEREMGTLCASIGPESKPVGFGLVSVATRPLDGSSGAYLGVGLASASDEKESRPGVAILSIRPNSPALKSGLQLTDRLLRVNSIDIKSMEDLKVIIDRSVPGDVLRVDVQRAQTQLTLMITLGDGANLAPMPGSREQAVDGESTAMSRRRWFFAKGIQHDGAISPRDCGGPLIDLDGRLLGINIARAGRIHSYAIPIAEVKQFLTENGIAIRGGEGE